MNANELPALIQELFNATLDDKRRFIEQHAEVLLDERTDAWFEKAIAQQLDEGLSQSLQFHHHMLQLCRSQGIEATFEAIEAQAQAADVDDAPSEWATTHNNLRNASQRLGEREAGTATLQAAVAVFHAALEVCTREEMPLEWARIHNNLGVALTRLGEREPGTVSLQAAVAAFRAALKVPARETIPLEWAMTQINLGVALTRLGERELGTASWQAAVNACRAALEVLSFATSPRKALRTNMALARAESARENWGDAVDTLESCLAVGIEAALSASNPRAQLGFLDAISGAGDRLAWALVQLGRPLPEVLAALDRGRGVLLEASHALQRLGHDDPAATALRAQRDAWQLACREAEAADDFFAAREGVEAAFEDYRAALQAAGLGGAPPARSLTAVAAALPPGGALVAPLVTELGGALLVVTCSTGSEAKVHRFDVPQLSIEALHTLLGAWFKGYDAFRNGLAASSGQLSWQLTEDWNAAIAATLEPLWTLLMGPVDASLRALGVEPGAEVVMLAPGRLAVLPLQAARQCDEATGRWQYFLDDWALSLVPTLGTLVDANARAKTLDAEPPRLLAVMNPTNDEAFPDEYPAWPLFNNDQRLALAGEAASVEAVLEQLPHWSYLGFYCHGVWSPQDPDASHLLMAEHERLSRAALSPVNLKGTRLTVLSACETHLISMLNTPDEFLGLPASFLSAGSAAVLATLWPVEVTRTADFTRHFFDVHLNDGAQPTRPAHALREAQLWLREHAERPPERSGLERASGGPRPMESQSMPTPATANSRTPSTTELLHLWAGFCLSGV